MEIGETPAQAVFRDPDLSALIAHYALNLIPGLTFSEPSCKEINEEVFDRVKESRTAATRLCTLNRAISKACSYSYTVVLSVCVYGVVCVAVSPRLSPLKTG